MSREMSLVELRDLQDPPDGQRVLQPLLQPRSQSAGDLHEIALDLRLAKSRRSTEERPSVT